jgi:hypothetical protein
MVTIIKPPSNNNHWKDGLPPYSLGLLKSSLSKEFDVQVEDLEIKMWRSNLNGGGTDCLSLFSLENVLEHCIKKENPALLKAAGKILRLTRIRSSVVVFYIEYANELLVALPLAKWLKKRKKKIVFLGHFFLGLSQDIIKYDFVDFIIDDPAGDPLRNLLRGAPGSDAPKEAVVPCFDGLPLETYKLYLKTYFDLGRLILPYKISQGCIYKCFFCNQAAHERFNFRDVDTCLTDLIALSRKYGSRQFAFKDNSFTISNRYTKTLCKNILSRKLNFEFIGMSHYAYLDEDCIKLLKEAGCKGLCFGVESTSLKGVYSLPKNRNLKNLPLILRWCKENDIWVHLFFISGFPFQSLADISQDIDFIKDNRDRIGSVLVNNFQLQVHSNIYKGPEKYGIDSIDRHVAPYQRNVPYSPADERQKQFLFNTFKEALLELKLCNIDPFALLFLFNPLLKKAIVNDPDKFLSGDSGIFLEKCKTYLESRSCRCQQ